MNITETATAPLQKTYRVTVEAADISRTEEEELKALGSRVKIPGFRPGNVPLKVLRQRYGKSIHGDVIKNVITDATEKVVRDKKLRIAMQPDVKVEDYKEGGDLVFSVSVELLPDMPEIDFSKFSLERDIFELPEGEIDSALERLATRYPNPVPIAAGQAAKQGHVVTMDFVGKVNGKAFEGGTAEDFRIELGSGRLIEGFEDQLIGLKKGAEAAIKVTFPENYFNKDLAGTPA